MLKEWKAPEQPSEEEVKARLAAAREKLAGQQLLIKEKKLPVFVLENHSCTVTLSGSRRRGNLSS